MMGKEFTETPSTIGIQSLTCEVHFTRESKEGWTEATRVEKELEAGIADMIVESRKRLDTTGIVGEVPSVSATIPSPRLPGAPKLKADAIDEELVMRCYNEGMSVSSADLRLSIFDYGGQSVFNVVHHLFLTQFGVYVAVFNMVKGLLC